MDAIKVQSAKLSDCYILAIKDVRSNVIYVINVNIEKCGDFEAGALDNSHTFIIHVQIHFVVVLSINFPNSYSAIVAFLLNTILYKNMTTCTKKKLESYIENYF